MHDPNGGAERARQHWSTVARGLAAWLALAGLLLHAAIPVGFMPGRDADGRFAIVVCGPSGGLNSEAATRLADLRAALGVPGSPAGDTGDAPDKAPAVPCAFGAATVLALADPAPALAVPAPAAGVRLAPPALAEPARTTVAGLGARGPPLAL